MNRSLISSLPLRRRSRIRSCTAIAGTTGTIAICCRAGQDEVTVQISDDAPAFDPLQVPEPDTSADLDDRVIGGLGIFLIRKVTDNATYRYEKAKNIMTLTKKRRPLS